MSYFSITVNSLRFFIHFLQAEGYPTIVFFPAGKKSADPVSHITNTLPRSFFFFFWLWYELHLRLLRLLQIPVESERTVVAFYKFIKKHASIPFKLSKPSSSPASSSDDSHTKEDATTSSSDVKDEL